jgi:hypothetical protein
MKPFNLEQALKGKPLVTRDGRKVTDIVVDETDRYPISAHVYDDDKIFGTLTYTIEGEFWFEGRENRADLFMADDQPQITPATRERFVLFATAFVQVLLVSLNTILLAHKQIASSIAVAGLISYVWTFNVKRAAFGSHWDKIIYSLGAACGSGVGIYLAGLIL